MIPGPEPLSDHDTRLRAEIRSLPKFAQKWVRPGPPRRFTTDQLEVLRRLLSTRPTLARHVHITANLETRKP